ncbi:MAG: DUF695 domain-containing protein [Sphingobacteriales bacterium]|nr:MAG: DUF695 domain-containing protein [Sphingobacteriales bacterium]
MLAIEQYATIYLPMMAAAGNPQQEESICNNNGITIAQWNEAKDFYTKKMMDPMDMGKTAMAFSAAMQAAPAVSQPSFTPANFVVANLSIYINENDIQFVEFLNKASKQHIVLQLGFEVHDDFEKNYINGRVYISINEPKYSLYGGVAKVELSSKEVKFIFDDEGKERMKCDSITAYLDINAKYYNYLKRKMKFMYKNILEIQEEALPETYEINGISFKDNWSAFTNGAMKISVRPHLEEIKISGKYPQVVFVDFMSSTIGQDANELALLNEMEACLIDTLEKDLAAVLTFHVSYAEKRRYFIYTYLSQNDFMIRINDAFKLLPQLPLQFSGGIDEKWENYNNCLADLIENR